MFGEPSKTVFNTSAMENLSAEPILYIMLQPMAFA
jgi:hypothetical protein